jgi:hypothetical protein
MEETQSIGIIFLRWNLYNRVAVAVAYFENGKPVFFNCDKKKIKTIQLYSLFR